MMCRLHAVVLSALLLSSCVCNTTAPLWNATDPDEYIRMPEASVSERVLQDRHLKYYKDDKAQVYYVEKSALRKLGDYSIRMFAVPVTVAIDAAPAILVIGAIVMGHGGAGSGFVNLNDQENSNKKQQQQDEIRNALDKITIDDLPTPEANGSRQ